MKIKLITLVILILLVPKALAVQFHTANEIRGGTFNMTEKIAFPDTTNVYFNDKVFVNKSLSPFTNPNITISGGIQIPGIFTVRGNFFSTGPFIDLVADYNKSFYNNASFAPSDYFINASYAPLNNTPGIQTPDEIDFVERYGNIYFTTDNANTVSPRISMNFSDAVDKIFINTPIEVYNWMDPYSLFIVQPNVSIILENVKLLPNHALCFEYKNASTFNENTSRYIGYCTNINITTGGCDCRDVVS